MSRHRALRAEKIVALRARTVDVLQQQLGQLTRRAALARDAVAQAERTWELAATAPTLKGGSSGDLGEAHAYLHGLARRIEALSAEQRQAQLDEEASRRKVCEAKMELRKIEGWRDRMIEAAQADEDALERRATDESAARIARGP